MQYEHNVLSVYVNNMGVHFWENKIVDTDAVRYKTEEDFGISHNRTMDIEAFKDIMKDTGFVNLDRRYIIIRDKNKIAYIKNEFGVSDNE